MDSSELSGTRMSAAAATDSAELIPRGVLTRSGAWLSRSCRFSGAGGLEESVAAVAAGPGADVDDDDGDAEAAVLD